MITTGRPSEPDATAIRGIAQRASASVLECPEERNPASTPGGPPERQQGGNSARPCIDEGQASPARLWSALAVKQAQY